MGMSKCDQRISKECDVERTRSKKYVKMFMIKGYNSLDCLCSGLFHSTIIRPTDVHTHTTVQSILLLGAHVLILTLFCENHSWS